MDYFYNPDITKGKLLLDEEESRHCIRVLRKKKGDEIIVLDGKGVVHLDDKRLKLTRGTGSVRINYKGEAGTVKTFSAADVLNGNIDPKVLRDKLVFVGMHFFGAIVSLQVVWTMGDVALGIVILPNLIALVLLSGKIRDLTRSYFERKPWLENAEVHRRLKDERRRGE